MAALRQSTPFSRMRDAPESRRSFGEATGPVPAERDRCEAVGSRPAVFSIQDRRSGIDSAAARGPAGRSRSQASDAPLGIGPAADRAHSAGSERQRGVKRL